MDFALHAATVMHTNVVTDVRVANDAGYDAIELWIPKLTRYLDAGYTEQDLLGELGSLRVTMLDTLMPIESVEPETRRQVCAECERMAESAAKLGCPAIQVVALDAFEHDDWAGQRRQLADSLNELADLAAPHGVCLAVEPVVFSRFNSLAQALELVELVGPERLRLCLDTWHLWTAGVAWDEVAALDPTLIETVHIGDTQARAESSWRDADRSALPGEGVLPLAAAIDAIRSTGYDGTWAVEMKSERHWEWDPAVLAHEILRAARAAMQP